MNKHSIISPKLLKGLSIAILGGLLTSCATMKADDAKDKEQLLAAAGFKMKLADSPAKLAHLQTLVQNKITMSEKDGNNYYFYADATTCQCLYVGQDADYKNFQQLQIEKNIAREEQITAEEMSENAAMNWGMWGYGMNRGMAAGFY